MPEYFQPLTEVYLCANTGIDEYNKPYFESNDEMASWLKSKAIEVKRNYSFQRADDRQYCSIDVDYNSAMECDTILFLNKGHDQPSLWIVGNITNVEFKNPNCTWVWFKVDAFCTYCGNIEWDKSYSLVEREHVDEDWIGGNPNWEAIGVPEDITANPERKLLTKKHDFGNFKVVVRDPYKYADQNIINVVFSNIVEPDFTGKMVDGIYEGLNSHVFSSAAEVNQHLNSLVKDVDSDINNVVDIQMVPQEILDGKSSVENLEAPWTKLELNNAKCYTSQFCMYAIESLSGPIQYYKPELCVNTPNIAFSYNAKWAAGTGGIAVYPKQYAGETQGAKINAFIINDFPKGTWTGNLFAQWMGTYGIQSAVRGIMGAIDIAQGAVGIKTATTTESVNTGVNELQKGFSEVVGAYSSITAAKQRGTAMGGLTANSTPNLAMAISEFGYYLTVYIGIESVMKAIDAFFDRFGYKVMQLKVPNRGTRPCWNYVKTAEGHVSGTMPALYRNQIEHMLNAGVTFWNVNTRDIGNFSDPAANK